MPFIVGIEECDVFTPCFAEPSIACHGNTAILLVDVPHDVGEPLANLSRLVRRAIVDHQDLEWLVVLRDRGMDCAGQHGCPVVRGNHDRHGRRDARLESMERVEVESAEPRLPIPPIDETVHLKAPVHFAPDTALAASRPGLA